MLGVNSLGRWVATEEQYNSQTQKRAASAHLLRLRKERVRTVKDCRGETKLFLSPSRTVSPQLPHFLWQGTPPVPVGIRMVAGKTNVAEIRKLSAALHPRFAEHPTPAAERNEAGDAGAEPPAIFNLCVLAPCKVPAGVQRRHAFASAICLSLQSIPNPPGKFSDRLKHNQPTSPHADAANCATSFPSATLSGRIVPARVGFTSAPPARSMAVVATSPLLAA